MCANKLKYWIYLQVGKLMNMELLKKLEN